MLVTKLDTRFSTKIQPNIHSLVNRVSDEDIFKEYLLPDVTHSDLLKTKGELSMVAGEFIQVYGSQVGKTSYLTFQIVGT